jgi:membrane protease YdiL (CAAX protease family)
VLGHRVLLVLRASIVVAALFLMGVKRRDAFLVVGSLNAPVGGQAAATGRQRLTWPVLGTAMSLLLGGMFFMFLSTQSPAMLSNISAVLPWIPIILLSAALNAIGEEVEYRAAPLATLLPVVGPTQSILLTSLWFGLGHYYGGIPSGVFALVYVSLLALLLGKAMVDTRGLGWSWIIHITIDTVIYIFIAATM